jgi:hypothetical protein
MKKKDNGRYILTFLSFYPWGLLTVIARVIYYYNHVLLQLKANESQHISYTTHGFVYRQQINFKCYFFFLFTKHPLKCSQCLGTKSSYFWINNFLTICSQTTNRTNTYHDQSVLYGHNFIRPVDMWRDPSDTSECAAKHDKDFPESVSRQMPILPHFSSTNMLSLLLFSVSNIDKRLGTII